MVFAVILSKVALYKAIKVGVETTKAYEINEAIDVLSQFATEKKKKIALG